MLCNDVKVLTDVPLDLFTTLYNCKKCNTTENTAATIIVSYFLVFSNKYMFHFIDINNFIHLNGCVGMGPTALLFPEAYNAVKAA
jgi:hypothetical protein